MQQVGLVVTASPETARVHVERRTVCGRCGLCGSLQTMGGGHRELVVQADNQAGAREGDLVRLETSSGGVLLAAAAAYMFPVAGLLLGAAAGSWLAQMGWGQTEVNAPLGGFVLLAGAFFWLRRRESRLARSRLFAPVVTAVLDPEEWPQCFPPGHDGPA